MLKQGFECERWNHLCRYVRQRFTSDVLLPQSVLTLQSYRGVFGSFDSKVRQAIMPAVIGVGKKTTPNQLGYVSSSCPELQLSYSTLEQRGYLMATASRVFPWSTNRKTAHIQEPHVDQIPTPRTPRTWFANAPIPACIFVETRYPEHASSLRG